MKIQDICNKELCDIVASTDGKSFDLVPFNAQYVERIPLRKVLIECMLQSEFVQLTIEVRRLQKHYFKTRNSADLVAARVAESQLDKVISKISNL